MRTPKIRKEKLSIYLARDCSTANCDIIKTEGAKEPIEIPLPETESSHLYIKLQPPKTAPPWTTLFTETKRVHDHDFGSSSNVGAAFIVRIPKATFILTFGTGFHLLNQDSIERDFGLRVTLNSVDPDKLRSLDKASYDHNPLNSRTQSTIDADVFNMHLDSEMEMLYAITGSSQVAIFGSHVTGRDALTIAVEPKLETIPPILVEALRLYKAQLPSKFSWVENIHRVRDPDEIEIAELELDKQLSSKPPENLWLGEPEIVDWENQLGYSFDLRPRTPRHVVLSFGDYMAYLDGTTPTVELMKQHLIHVNNSEYHSIKSWSVYRCLYAEVKIGSDNYILRNGSWYKVNRDFASSVDSHLKELDSYSYTFPIYARDREEDYSKEISTSEKGFCLMDKKNIRIGGSYDKLEHCDLIKNGNEFIHIKKYRSSSTLSHLFAQGLVSAEAFIKDTWYREQLNPKLPHSIRLPDPSTRPDPSKYRIVYAIATTKKIPEELPFFSKVTLKNALKTLKALNYQVSIAQIAICPTLLKKQLFKPKTR